MADSSLDKTNINNLNQNEKHIFGQIDRFILDTPDTLAVVDGIVTANRLLECKTSSAFSKSDWGEAGTDQESPLYLVQSAWYLAITECEAADLAVLIGNNDFRICTIARDLEHEGLFLSHAQAFWHEHVLAQKPPKPVNVQDVQLLFPKEAAGNTVEASQVLLEQIKKYQSSCAKAQELSDECEMRIPAIVTTQFDRS